MLLKFIEKNHENKLLVSLIPLCHLNINFYVIMHNFKIIIKIQNTRQHVHWGFFCCEPEHGNSTYNGPYNFMF